MNHSFKKLAIASAVSALFAVPMAANATTVTSSAGKVSANHFKTSTQTISNAGTFSINATSTEVYLGRTTGFNVVITLNGAKFSAAVGTPTKGTGLSTAGGANWTATVAGGGTAGSTSVTYAIQPTSTDGVREGSLLNFAAGAFTMDNASALATPGATITATVVINDPVGGNALPPGSSTSGTLATSTNAIVFTAPTGSTTARIDVGQDATHGPKSYFSMDGTIKKLDSGYFGAGQFKIAPAATASCLGITVGSGNCTAGFDFAFNTAGAPDTATITVNGTDFSGFKVTGAGMYVIADSSNGCSAGAVNSAVGLTGASTALGANLVTFPGIALPQAGGTYSVCMYVPVSKTNSIAAQALNLGVAVTMNDSTNVAGPGSLGGTLFPLQYNGTVRTVYFVNPASNATVRSVLRVSNSGSTGGKVTITGVRDDGTLGNTGGASFTLDPNKSVQWTISELETGVAAAGKPALTGSLGTGTGKWVLSVSAEFGTMAVMSFTQDAATNIINNMSSIVDGPTAQQAN